MKIRLSKAISWVGPEKKGVSKIFFLTFLTSDKHSMAKKSDRTHHSFSDPTLKRPSKDPIRSLREHKIGEHKSKVFQRSSRGIQDSREYVPPLRGRGSWTPTGRLSAFLLEENFVKIE